MEGTAAKEALAAREARLAGVARAARVRAAAEAAAAAAALEPEPEPEPLVVPVSEQELSGVDAFIYVWHRTNGYRWLASIIGLPVVYHLSKIAYFFLAYILFWRYKYFAK